MELYLIRHAEMQGDPHSEHQPPVENCLSELGCQQAMALREVASAHHFSAVFCSPLGRAVQTAQSVAREGQTIHVLPWLMEWKPATVLGMCEESEYESVAAAAALLRPEESWKTPAGEGTLEMAQRVIVGFQRLMAAHGVRCGHGGYLLEQPDDQQKIALVAHGGSLACLTGFLMGIPIRPFTPISFSFTGTAVFKFVRRIDVWHPTLVIPPMPRS
jgi:probable phosphoglycerate mutase